MKRAYLLALAIILLISTRVFAQNISNEGTDFWAVFPTHVANGTSGTTINNHAEISVFVTSKQNSLVTVSCRNYTATKVIPANTAVEFKVDWAEAYIAQFNSGLPSEGNQVLPNRGIHIKVADGQPSVSAYTHIYAGNRSAASLILPYETLGQTYYSMNYTQVGGGNNYLTIVAVDDNSTVLLHEKNGNVKSIVFPKAGDVYEYIPATTEDLTGVYVESDPTTSKCNRFAAFSGSTVMSIVCTGSADPLYQQLYPTVSWGKNYGIVPFVNRKYILRILAQEDNTKITYNGQTYTVNKGSFIESEQLTEPTFVSADKLISVAQYSLTQSCSSAIGRSTIGDPEMVILNPVEYNIKAITVFSSTLQLILERYINVFMQTNKTATFKVDGVKPVVTWKPIPGNPTYSYIQIPLSNIASSANFNSLTLTADEGFNATAYGFGNTESYAYSAGTNLFSNNYLTVVNEAKDEEYQNGCIGDQIDFKINLPYKPDKIKWTLDDGVSTTQNNPVGEEKIVNGQKVYVYRYVIDKVYTVVGEYKLKVNVHVPNGTDNCQSGDFESNYIFNIYELPIAGFDFQPSSCASSQVQFNDKSNPNTTDFSITNWLWDFKDEQISTQQNPTHSFIAEGKYNVSLFVKSGAGCYSDVIEKEIEIYPLPVSNFIAPEVSCINTEITLEDKTAISNAFSVNNIVGWKWDFGDGSAISTDQNPKHTYAAPGTYTIKLIATSDRGCVSVEKSASILINKLPVADFTTPNICLTDAVANFVNTSSNTAGNDADLTYLWDFGDRYLTNANLSTNTSTNKNGVHTYTKADTYNVKLTITNANGCSTEKIYPFTVNGALPKANFEILPSNSFCSGSLVSIKNTSTVDFGTLTKIEVYKDFVNHPEDFVTFNYPFPAQIELNYEQFGTPAEREFQVKVVAYSGTQCADFIVKPITLKASPMLAVDEIASVCENDGNITLTSFRETSGAAGSGIYDGRGINANGTFNPKLAGEGTHNISYTFTTTGGCTASVTASIQVNKSPIVYAGSVIYVLAGGEIQIPAEASGENLTYEWTPATGLSNNKILNPIASPDQDTNYTLTVTTQPGLCVATSQVAVKILEGINPPNSFSPNGDGFNDVWQINYLETYPKATVEIFNRNGSRVFFSNGYKIPFDGNYKNEQLPVGVYYYIINPQNGRKTMTGPLTIIR